MKVIIAGSRGFTDYELFKLFVADYGYQIDEIISGGASGVDKMAERYAAENNIPITVVKPDWSTGKGAGFVRNTKMMFMADGLLAVWDGKSPGTSHMIDIMFKAKGKKVSIMMYGG